MEKIFNFEGGFIKYSPISVEKGLEIIENLDIGSIAEDAGVKESITFVKKSIGLVKDFIISASIEEKEMTKEELLGDFDNAVYVVNFATHLINALNPTKQKKTE
jgi:hypothetical protein